MPLPLTEAGSAGPRGTPASQSAPSTGSRLFPGAALPGRLLGARASRAPTGAERREAASLPAG